MEQKLKYRLVGAAVILALMAFFLPLILDSKKYKTEIVSQIPPMPSAQQTKEISEQRAELPIPASDGAKNTNNHEAKPLIIELDKGLAEQGEEQEKNAHDEKPQEQIASTESNNAETLAATEKAAPVAKTDNNTKPDGVTSSVTDAKQVEQKLADIDKEASTETNKVSQPASKQTVIKEPSTKVEEKPVDVAASKAPDFKESAYVIQIGSFSNKENASKLVDDLRKQDYRAYQRVSKDFSRVFVGPYPEMSIAEARSSKLAEIVGNQVKVIEFDPIKH